MASKGFVIGGHPFAAPPLSPGLYLVATPIGNLGDITVRALETLAGADQVLCEDTRVTAKLFARYGIDAPRRPYHQHNETRHIGALLNDIRSGRAVALVSDAGTPLLSDPGFPLVRAARTASLPVFAIPGPSAMLAGLTASGLPVERFSFFGFLPSRAAARRTAIEALAERNETLVFYESARRLPATLAALADILGGARPAVVGRELTKKFETVYADPLGDLASRFAGEPVKGEVVIVVAGMAPAAADPEVWRAALSDALARQPLKSAVDKVASGFEVSRREVYRAALAIRDRTGD